MKKVQNIVLAVVALALAVVVIWYYASGQEHKNNDQAIKTQIQTNWAAFFNGQTSAQGKINLLQNGQDYAQVIEAQAQSATAKATTAKVSSVSLSGNSATVTYTIDIAGQPALSNQKGQAVNVNGSWKVGDGAFCGLLQLSGTVPPNCK